MTIFSLKLTAMILMLLDHIGEFFPAISPITVLSLRYLGRLSAPIFVFCTSIGIRHTSSKKNYLKRLYAFSVIMGLGNTILAVIFPNPPVICSNNIMSTLFLIAALCFISEIRKEDKSKGNRLIILFIISQMVFILLYAFGEILLGEAARHLFSGLFPNFISCEGGLLIIVMGYFLYRFNQSKRDTAVFYTVYCVVYLVMTIVRNIGFGNIFEYLFLGNFQWAMIFALFFMLKYNGEKGCGGKFTKYFFYIFYPLHIWILFILSNIIN